MWGGGGICAAAHLILFYYMLCIALYYIICYFIYYIHVMYHICLTYRGGVIWARAHPTHVATAVGGSDGEI